jgi:hypothetical protein
MHVGAIVCECVLQNKQSLEVNRAKPALTRRWGGGVYDPYAKRNLLHGCSKIRYGKKNGKRSP